MYRQVKYQLIKALNSGDYVQFFGRLRSVDKLGQVHFCVMGVLCDLYVKSHPEENGWDCATETRPNFAGMAFGPPPAVIAWAGISAEERRELTSLNDHGLSFKDLATELHRSSYDHEP